MKDSDIQAVALKHGLPMTHSYGHPWSYVEQVMAFGRELAGDTPPRRVFPPLPLSVFEHPKLGEMWMRFDLHSYAERHARNVQDELDALKAAQAKPVECAARKQRTAGGNAPADCDWPGCDCDPEAGKVIEALLEQHNVATTFAQRDVLKERSEQDTREGFGPAHDDAHRPGVLAAAAVSYVLAAHDELSNRGLGGFSRQPSRAWPFAMTWWKPKNPRNAMVKAAALLLAEIERMDRSAYMEKKA
jgi:hypothetical protein